MQRLYYVGKGTTEVDFEQIILMHKKNISQDQFNLMYQEIIDEKPDATINQIANMLCKRQGFWKFNPKYWVGVNVSFDAPSNDDNEEFTSDVDIYRFIHDQMQYTINIPKSIYKNTAEAAIIRIIEHIGGLPVLMQDPDGAVLTQLDGAFIIKGLIPEFTQQMLDYTVHIISSDCPKICIMEQSPALQSTSKGITFVRNDQPKQQTFEEFLESTETTQETRIFSGILKVGEYGEEFDILLLNDSPFTEQTEDITKKMVSIRYFTSDKPMKSIEEAEVNLLKHLDGATDIEYYPRYSECTGYLWTDEEFKVGGHDLLAELKAQAQEPIFFIMEVIIFTPIKKEGNEEK